MSARPYTTETLSFDETVSEVQACQRSSSGLLQGFNPFGDSVSMAAGEGLGLGKCVNSRRRPRTPIKAPPAIPHPHPGTQQALNPQAMNPTLNPKHPATKTEKTPPAGQPLRKGARGNSELAPRRHSCRSLGNGFRSPAQGPQVPRLRVSGRSVTGYHEAS